MKSNKFWPAICLVASACATSSSAIANENAPASIGYLGRLVGAEIFNVFMDTENTGNGDWIGGDWNTGWNQPSTVGFERTTKDHGGMLWTISKVKAEVLPVLAHDYAVLRFSDHCPANGLPFSQVFDN